jgi:gag-polyprotein putative aspartyl protease
MRKANAASDFSRSMKSALSSLLCLALLTACRHTQEERFPADVRINDKPACFVYDTGAGITLVHTRAAKRLGLKVTKPPSSMKPGPGRVSIGHTEFCNLAVNQETYRLKLATVHLPWPWESLLDMDGVIGWPDLKDDFLAIDASDDTIKSVPGLPRDPNAWIKLPLYRRTEVLALQIPYADGKTGVLEIDTGNPDAVSLSPARWKAWRANHRHAHRGWHFTFMPGSGLFFGRTYEAEDLSIGPLTWKRVGIRKASPTEIHTAEGGDVFEGSIGIAALRQLNLIIDRTNHIAWLQPNPDWARQEDAHRPKASCNAAPAKSTVRLDFRAHEYGDLAMEAFESDKFDAVITNITRLLELEPDNAGALAVRGTASFRMQFDQGGVTNLDQALSDLSRALELDPGITPLYNIRAHIYYLTQRWDSALKDFRHFCEKDHSEANYPRFFIWLMTARKGERAAADQELGACFGPGKRPKASRWEKDIGAFLLGNMSEAAFLRAASRGHDPGLQCEAWFYAGMKRLLSGDAATAQSYFKKCLATDKKDFDEYIFAAAELRRLDQQRHPAATPGGA